MNIKERVKASKEMTPLQIAERSTAFRNKYAERMMNPYGIRGSVKQPNAIPFIEESYDRIGGDSDYSEPYGTVNDWLKLNKLNITPDEFRSNSMYQSAYKNWAESLKRK